MALGQYIHLEITANSLRIMINNQQPLELHLDQYEVIDGRIYKPQLIAQRLHDLTLSMVAHQVHVTIYHAALAGKKDPEQALITLQIVLMIAKLGWIVDAIIASPFGTGKPEIDCLAKFRPPAHQSLYPWIIATILIMVISFLGCVSYGRHIKERFNTKTADVTNLKKIVDDLEQEQKTRSPYVRQHHVFLSLNPKTKAVSNHNRLITDFMNVITERIPPHCWLEKLSCTNSHKITSFVIEGRTTQEKDREFFYTTLLDSPLVACCELSTPCNQAATESKKAIYTFVLKGQLHSNVSA